jgi:hypothetical protein
MQATISKPILLASNDESVAVGTSTLIVPNALRESINVGSNPVEQINLVELKALLTSLKTLGITDFTTGNFSATVITGKSDAQLTLMLASGSMHVTFDNMLHANPNIVIPELAQTDLLFSITNLTLANEIKYFILAANVIGGSDFTNVDFDYNAILLLTSDERNTVAKSMIVRNILTPDLETAVAAKNILIAPTPGFNLNEEDYELNELTTFLTELDFIEVLKFLNDEAYTDD